MGAVEGFIRKYSEDLKSPHMALVLHYILRILMVCFGM